MLYSLKGKLVYTDQSSIAVDCGGVAYLCRVSLSTLAAIGSVGTEVEVLTHLLVRNEALELFAFADRRELDCFKMLIGVTGVGPKVALGILSCLPPDRFALCVAAGDAKSLATAPGVGKKLAERVVMELRDKIAGADLSAPQAAVLGGTQPGDGNMSEAAAALEALGYARADAALALAKLDNGLPVEELIKTALKKLAGR